MSDLLPGTDDRAWLLEELAGLVAARGHETFVAAPLLEPTPAHFPDAWTPDGEGVRRLARHLLAQVGLGHLDVRVELFHSDREVREVDAHGRPAAWGHQGTAAWYAGTERGVCFFGADAAQLDQPAVLVGLMAHEVAHAYRDHHRLEVGDRGLEELLTDLTTVYLGFGILTANAAYRFETRGGADGALASTTEWQTSGYLKVGDMAFLLAVHTLARRDAEALRVRVAGHLGVTQRSLFKDACKAMAREGLDLAETLGLPPRPAWPTVGDVSTSAAASPGEGRRAPGGRRAGGGRGRDGRGGDEADGGGAATAAETAAETAALRVRHRGQPVFRLARDRGSLGGTIGLVLGAGIGTGLVGVAGMSRIVAAVLAFAAAIVGWRIGRRGRHDVCAEPSCSWVIPAEARVCPGCGGTVRGRVAHADDRLAASEELE